MKRDRIPETNASLRIEYLMAACYAFFRAEDADENLVSALRRLQAERLRRKLEGRGAQIPAPAEVREWAVQRFGEERLHQDKPARKGAA